MFTKARGVSATGGAGAGVTGGCEQPNVGCRGPDSSTRNYWAISLTPTFNFYFASVAIHGDTSLVNTKITSHKQN